MIYFMQPTDGGPVKIGFSDNVDVRRQQLEAHYGKPLAVLATLEGSRDKERELHERFGHLRFGRTEQFRPAVELMSFIGRPLLVDANPDAVEVMEPKGFDPDQPPTKAVKIERALAAKAQMIATDKGVSLADYISETLRGAVEKDWGRMVKRVGGSIGP